MTKSERAKWLSDEYRAAGGRWPATTNEIAFGAVENGKWIPSKGKLIAECAAELSRGMRETFIKDPQGRTVRSKHAARVKRDGKQVMLWDDITSASLEHMAAAFSLRRRQIVGDCYQLKSDVDSYNENYNEGVPIQMAFNFTVDLEERELDIDAA